MYQRRLALERKIGKDALECKEVVDLIEGVGLMNNALLVLVTVMRCW